MNESGWAEGILIQQNGEVVPLIGVDVRADIAGRGAKVKISQHFKNKEKKPIEAVNKFPLPEHAAVCGFQALIEDRIVEGQIEEKEKAFELYDQALADLNFILSREPLYFEAYHVRAAVHKKLNRTQFANNDEYLYRTCRSRMKQIVKENQS